jgi:hypothetical protein
VSLDWGAVDDACYSAGVSTDPARTLTVTARDVADRKFDPSAYPFQHLAVVQVAKIGTPDSQIPLVMGAVEMLGQVGWDLVAFTMANRTVAAVMRRRQGPGQPG